MYNVILQVRWGDKGATEEGNKLSKSKVMVVSVMEHRQSLYITGC